MLDELSRQKNNTVILVDKIRHLIEADENFCDYVLRYCDIMQSLNCNFVELNDQILRNSYANETSLIVLIVKLLKRYCIDDSKSEQFNDFIHRIDNINLFSYFIDQINDEIIGYDIEYNNISYESILQIFSSLQTIQDKKLFGQFYTPENMINLAFDMLDFNEKSICDIHVVDPACGAGAFLLKMIDVYISEGFQFQYLCKIINNNLHGFDVNPAAVFLCKLSMFLKVLSIIDNEKDIQYAFEKLEFCNIKNINTITANICDKFDLIIGNPPYFKIKNNTFKSLPEYKDIFNGQGNIYTVFMKWSLLHLKIDGEINLIVPQSFRSGKYFKKIREDLCQYKIKEILSVNSRKKTEVFSEAEQSVLIIYIRNGIPIGHRTKITNTLDGKELHNVGLFFQSDLVSNESIVLPIDNISSELYLKIKRKFKSFAEVEPSLTFGNGLFVWNQNKSNLSSLEEDNVPIIYANYICENGFDFSPENNNSEKPGTRRPYCIPNEKCKGFLCNGAKLIVKRTSGMENFLRIKSCIISQKFLENYNEYFLENHINYLYDKKDKNKQIDIDKLLYISAYLRSDIANFMFKLANGNTQISASELNDLPFIYNRKMEIINLMKEEVIDMNRINQFFNEIFELTSADIKSIISCKENCLR